MQLARISEASFKILKRLDFQGTSSGMDDELWGDLTRRRRLPFARMEPFKYLATEQAEARSRMRTNPTNTYEDAHGRTHAFSVRANSSCEWIKAIHGTNYTALIHLRPCHRVYPLADPFSRFVRRVNERELRISKDICRWVFENCSPSTNSTKILALRQILLVGF